MSYFNSLTAPLTCPRCGTAQDAKIKLYFGDAMQMTSLNIGDRYPWRERKSPDNGGRPPDGNWTDLGYTECAACHKDIHLRVTVKRDVIVGIRDVGPGYAP
jgi:hypothetical protein